MRVSCASWRSDSRCAPIGIALFGGSRAQHVDGDADRRQRIAQLVAEHGQELVLAAIRLAQHIGDGALCLELPAFVLRLLPIGDVLSDRLVLDGVAMRVEDSASTPVLPARRSSRQWEFDLAARDGLGDEIVSRSSSAVR